MREIYAKYYTHLIAEKVDLLGICNQQHLTLRLFYSSCTINFRVILQTAWSAKQVLFNLTTCTLYGRQDFPLLILGYKSDLIVDKRLLVLCLLSLKFYNTVNN